MKNRLISISLCLIILSLPVAGVFSEDQTKEKTQWGAIWRSIILPGSGYRYLGNNKKGKKILRKEIILIGGAFLANYFKNQVHNEYNRAWSLEEMESYYNTANILHYASNAMIIYATGVWLYSIFDINKNYKKYKEERLSIIKIETSIALTNNSIGVVFNREF